MSLRDDAIAIWKAGVAAVDSTLAVERQIVVTHDGLDIAGVRVPLTPASRIEIVGAGKAGAGMASGVEAALLTAKVADRISGWVNVPADCVRKLKHIHLHAARPAGINEPTQQAVDGTAEILRRVQSLSELDVCIVLLSGGASALLCSPIPGITLNDKLLVTRALAGAGAPIQELNLVRTQLSQVKGGRLAAACRAGTLIALIISDVIGDPLDVIGSGPTAPSKSRAADAIVVLRNRNLLDRIPPTVLAFLKQQAEREETVTGDLQLPQPRTLVNHIVASNAIAIDAARTKAEALGYEVESLGSENAGEAADEGRRLIQRLTKKQFHSTSKRHQSDFNAPHRICILSGGEPTVNLSVGGPNSVVSTSDSKAPALGGRNQELVLAAIAECRDLADWKNAVLLSAGTDGEDGPTDAAGAIADVSLLQRIVQSDLDIDQSLARHDSYHFFDVVDGLFKTGPTHTNVMDLRVGLRVGMPCSKAPALERAASEAPPR
jgi:glycerate 2-kinase